MGAIFGILGAYYYWSEKIIGYKYNEYLSKLQFYSFFIGVNILFFPMHFLGLAGMPRRIVDYPDSYAYWNYIASYGSILSFLSFILLIYIIFKQLNDKIISSKQFYINKSNDYFILDNNYYIRNNHIEFLLSNPPIYHSYLELPLL